MPPYRIALVLALLLTTLTSTMYAHPRAEEDEFALEEEVEEDMVSERPPESIEETVLRDINTTLLSRRAEDNSSGLKRLADVMKQLIRTTSSERCLGSGGNTERLTTSIKEGFSILVGAVQDLNNTLRHFKEEINQKVFSDPTASEFEDDGPCPSPFFQAGEDCIYIETEHLRFFDAARQACIEMGAKLAEFSNFDAFISAVAGMDMHEDAEIYIGGSDLEREGTWLWLSGSRMKNVPWGRNEPNNLPYEDCIALRPHWKKFNDIRCTYRREFACKWER